MDLRGGKGSGQGIVRAQRAAGKDGQDGGCTERSWAAKKRSKARHEAGAGKAREA